MLCLTVFHLSLSFFQTEHLFFLSTGSLVAQHASDLPMLLREGCAHMVRVCVNEYQLYQHFFSTVHEGLDDLLDHLTRVLYDEVRPLILRRNVR